MENMEINSKARSAFELIAELKALQSETYDAIMEEIDKIEPIKEIKQVSPHICVVNLSAVQKNKGILSPEYYIPDAQKDAIKKSLSNCGKDLEKITRKVKDMIDKGYIDGRYSHQKVMLNLNSLKLLEELYKNLI